MVIDALWEVISELDLNCRGVDSEADHEVVDGLENEPVVVLRVSDDVDHGDALVPLELPDVEFVDSDKAVDLLELGFNLFDIDRIWALLGDSECCLLEEAPGAVDKDEDDEEGKSWVEVDLARPVGELIDNSGNTDSDGAEEIAHDVEENALDVVAVRVIMEHEHANDVGDKTNATDDEEEKWVLDLWWFHKTLDDFEDQKKADSKKENGVG